MPEDGAEPLAQESSNAASGQRIRNLVSDLVHQLSKTSTRTGSPCFFSPYVISQFLNSVACVMQDGVDNQCFMLALKSITPTVVWYPTAGSQTQHILTAYCSQH